MSSDSGHGPEHPLFARVYDPVMSLPERLLLADHRAHLAEGLSGMVLDIGSGTGAMFPHYPVGAELTVHGIEPDPHMRRQAVDRADRLDLDIEVGFHAAGGCNLNRRTGDTLTGDHRFELFEYDRFESGLSRFLPLIRGRLKRRRESAVPP